MKGLVTNLKQPRNQGETQHNSVFFRRGASLAESAPGVAGAIQLGARQKTKSLRQRIVSYRYIYLLLLPGLAYFIIFAYVPMYGIQLAFKEYSVAKGIFGSPWVGLDKFKLLLEYPEFARAFRNTIVIALLKILFGFPIPIFLALLLNELRRKRLRSILQTVYTFPHFLSWVVVAGIAFNLLRDDGAINNLIATLGGGRLPFLQEPHIFRGLIIFSDIWKEAGWGSIMYLAAIAGIDPGLYESAMMDGATRWQRILHITWPGIAGMAAILLILAIGNVMNAGFDQIFNLYNPPVFSTADIIDTYIYRQSFFYASDFGYTTAVGLFKGVINCVLLLGANSLVRRFGPGSII